MTISDLIARLTRIMKETGSTAQVKLGSTYNSVENPFDFFDIKKPVNGNDVYLVPSDIWLKSDLKRLAAREVQQ